jgi:histidinol phosphatase-like PHP family hydrolase
MREDIFDFKRIQVPQDLHIHTIFSAGDGAVVSQQTAEFISTLRHAKIIGISDHFEYITSRGFDKYEQHLRSLGLKVGTEVDGGDWATEAAKMNVDYFVYHCRDRDEDYKGIDCLLNTGKPLIIAHPLFLKTNLSKVPVECYVEINNRYIWRSDWKIGFTPFLNRFKFVINSDAHQPNWLNQNVARFVANQLGIKETILF